MFFNVTTFPEFCRTKREKPHIMSKTLNINLLCTCVIVCIHVCIAICIWICVNVSVCSCVWIYMCTCLYIDIHIYIYIYSATIFDIRCSSLNMLFFVLFISYCIKCFQFCVFMYFLHFVNYCFRCFEFDCICNVLLCSEK